MQTPTFLSEPWARRRAGLRHLSLTVGFALLPLIALADEDDNKPLDPQTKSIQLWTWGVTGAVIVAVAAWYWLRRWQIQRSGNTVDGMRNNQD